MEPPRPSHPVTTTHRLCFRHLPDQILPKYHFHQLPSIDLNKEAKLSPRQFPIEPQGPRRLWEPGWDQGMRPNIWFFVDKPIVRSDPPQLSKTSPRQSESLAPNGREKTAENSNNVGNERLLRKSDPRLFKESSNDQSAANEIEVDSASDDVEKEGERRGEEKEEEEEEEKEEEKKEAGGEGDQDPLAGLTREEINRLAIRAFWTSTTMRMTQEACLPVPKIRPPDTTLEIDADVVKFRPHRYDSASAQWQMVLPPVWDRLQERARIKPNVSFPRPTNSGPSSADSGTAGVFKSLKQEHSKAKSAGVSPIHRPKSGKVTERKQRTISVVDNRICDLVKHGRLTSTYVRQCPGYSGYRPRSPLRIPVENRHEPNLRMMTTMKASYRPRTICHRLCPEFTHKAPLSRTVTLTYPYNPFNKVEKRREYRRNDI